MLSFINRHAFTGQEKFKKRTQKSILFYAYYFQTTSSFEGHWLNQKDLMAWLCNKHDAIAWCLLGHQFFQGQLSEFTWQSFHHPWSHSGSFVLIIWVKCVLESIDLVNLGFPLGKKKEVSLWFLCGQHRLWLCDCVVGTTPNHHRHCVPGTLICESFSSSLTRRKVETEIKVN